MGHELIPRTLKQTLEGKKDTLGATLTPDGVNFALFSQNASEVFLLLFDDPSGEASDIIKLENRTDNVWHVFVKGVEAGQLYGYKVKGEYNPAQGKRFNPSKLLIDPYAKALTAKHKDKDHLLFGYDLNSRQKDLAMDERDNSAIVPKCIVVDDNFDWQGDRPLSIPMDELIVYETHVKGFTAHPSSGVEHPGTYLGFVEKIPYLKDLGINAVEFMPVQDFFIRPELLEKGLTDYWGYNTIGFFAPEVSYSTQSRPGCQVEEFKTLVRELHKAGIEVILDVVYNHTGEGNELGPTLCFKGIDNPAYYSLAANPDDPEGQPMRHYLNDTGCGNTFNVEDTAAMRLVMDSLRYWVNEMHVDGFRFDLASILARVEGKFHESSKFFEEISKDAVLSKVKMIAEPWDLTTYEVGNFPEGWSEWNGKFRDTARQFLKGDERQASEMAKRITGSADLYRDTGRKPYNSINFITCHDGFTLWDLYSYNGKHNEANLEDNKDGSDHNHSWNCGVEGGTDDQNIIRFRKQMVKNALCCLMFSAGTPMLLYGDEICRTQKGNNNAYCQDNELTWLNWEADGDNAEVLEFCKKAIAFRKKYPILRHKRFFDGEHKEGGMMPDISWFGRHRDTPRWNSPKLKTLSYLLSGHEAPSEEGHYFLFVVLSMHHRGTVIDLPKYEGLVWYRLIDTSRRPGEDFRSGRKEKLLRNQEKHYCKAYSVNVFLGESRST